MYCVGSIKLLVSFSLYVKCGHLKIPINSKKKQPESFLEGLYRNIPIKEQFHKTCSLGQEYFGNVIQSERIIGLAAMFNF